MNSQVWKLFLWGLLISFLGSLPLGTMNVAVTQISVRDGERAAYFFAMGAMIVEIIYVRLMLATMEWMNAQYRLFRLFSWITLLALLSMAIASFVAAYKMTGIGNSLPAFANNHFLFGLVLSAFNPMHIVFWMGWSVVLLNKKILIPSNLFYTFYVSGIGAGTILGFSVFIYGGNYLTTLLKNKQHLLNWFIGCILLLTAIMQLWKMHNKRANRQLV